MEGLLDTSRAPLRHPQQRPAQVREQVLALRQQYVRWGPRKLRAYLEQHQPEIIWPAASTMGEWLKEEGLAQPRRKRRRTPPLEHPLAHATAPNQVWCADFKGWFRTGDDARIDPLTLTDAASRYLLRCVVVRKTDGVRVQAVLEAAFREFGLPEAIRTDNGSPFASRAPAGLSRLSLWWIRLGIRPERIAPGQPQQNGRHERFHLTLAQETAMPPARTRRAQQRVFQQFAEVYNRTRPHQALGYRTPDSCYTASARRYPARVPEPEFPKGCVMRRISQQGSLRWRGERTFISAVLGHEPVGMLRVSEKYWEMFYGPVSFGWFDGVGCRFHPSHQRPRDLQSDES
jgi:transposase InsO family protein